MAALINTATTPLGPLLGRTDSLLQEQPGSAKMVSLADLHTTNTPLVIERDVDGVDPLDPLLQTLVQDQIFMAAVQTGQLHAAAASAVKLFRSHLAQQSSDPRRPADRRFPSGGRDGEAASFLPPHAGSTQPFRPPVRASLQTLINLRRELLALEEAVPWTAVRRTWKSKRTMWRRQVKTTELVSELALRLKELRTALLTDDLTFIGCGHSWSVQLDTCMQNRGTEAALLSVWDELKNTINSWLDGKPALTASEQAQAGAARAIQAMQAGVKLGVEGLLQTPLESILGNDTHGLHAVRQAIELERRVVVARLAAFGTDHQQQQQQQQVEPMVSYFTSINAGWHDSDFDSGAETEEEAGSEVTNMDEDLN